MLRGWGVFLVRCIIVSRDMVFDLSMLKNQWLFQTLGLCWKLFQCMSHMLGVLSENMSNGQRINWNYSKRVVTLGALKLRAKMCCEMCCEMYYVVTCIIVRCTVLLWDVLLWYSNVVSVRWIIVIFKCPWHRKCSTSQLIFFWVMVEDG